VFAYWTAEIACSRLVFHLYEWLVEDKEACPVFALDGSGALEAAYKASSSDRKDLAALVIDHILYAREHSPARTKIIPLEPLHSNTESLVERCNCTDAQRTLLNMAISEQDVIVILSDSAKDRGIDEAIRTELCKTLRREAIVYLSEFLGPRPFILTEGKTDWKHLKAALRSLKEDGKFLGLSIEFYEYESRDMGSPELEKVCKYGSLASPKDITICIFDRDEPDILRRILDQENPKGFRYWGNNVYSFALPVPDRRPDARDYVCIEFYYSDAEIRQKDVNGRRLFTSDEFRLRSGHHKENTGLVCADRNKLRGKRSIVDDQVFDAHEQNVALSKNDFANYILDRVSPFDNFDFSEFAKVFDLILVIIDDSPRRRSQAVQ